MFEKVNFKGNECAKCINCGKYNSERYEFDKEDWRDLQCSECDKLSPFPHYFLKSLQEAKEEYQRKQGVNK